MGLMLLVSRQLPVIMMVEADQQQLNPPASQSQCPGVHWQALRLAKQQLINLMYCDLVQ
jgi:hypothetical protein